jgi:outer membrane receptor for ferrienterochelin and colicins
MGRQSILFGQLRWEQQLGAKHAIVAGAASRYTYYDDNSTATIDAGTQQNRPDKVFLPGVFLQDEWKLHAKHQLLLGARWDYHPVHKNIFTPRVAYKWSIDENQTLRMNAGTGFRVVNLFTEDHAALTGARVVEIREALQPERSYNVNLNYLRRLGHGSFQWTIDASIWYTYFHNQIVADYFTDPQKIIYENLKGHAESKGATLNLELNWRQRLKGMLGVTLQDVALFEADTDGKIERQQQPFTERWSGTWSLSYSFPISGWTIDYTGNIYGPMQLPLASEWDPRSPVSPVWSIQNIQLTKWMSKELELFGGVKNLLNWTPARNNPFLIARAHDPFDKKVDLGPDGQVLRTAENPYGLTFDPTYMYAPNQGIRFFLGLRYSLR